jgi:hypothetical protein
MSRGVDLSCLKCAAGGPHEWAGPVSSGDDTNPCKHCGTPGRLKEVQGQENMGHFAQATAARAERFSRLAQPKSVKAWGKQS